MAPPGFPTSRQPSRPLPSPNTRPGTAASVPPAPRSCGSLRTTTASAARYIPGRQFTRRARGGADERSDALLGDLLGGGQPGRRLTPLRRHSLRAGRPGRSRHRADRRPRRLGESPGLLARELTASRDDELAAFWTASPLREGEAARPPRKDRRVTTVAAPKTVAGQVLLVTSVWQSLSKTLIAQTVGRTPYAGGLTAAGVG